MTSSTIGTEATVTPAALEGCVESCRRCEQAVELLSAAPPEAGAVYAAVGPHLRHCVDHFVCLLRGLHTGLVDYDARDRDAEIEGSPGRFLQALRAVREALGRLGRSDLDRSIRVVQAAAPGRDPVVSASNVERELIFLSSHTIHHLAILAAIAKPHGLEIPVSVYTAYSTAAYREKQAAERS